MAIVVHGLTVRRCYPINGVYKDVDDMTDEEREEMRAGVSRNCAKAINDLLSHDIPFAKKMMEQGLIHD